MSQFGYVGCEFSVVIPLEIDHTFELQSKPDPSVKVYHTFINVCNATIHRVSFLNFNLTQHNPTAHLHLSRVFYGAQSAAMCHISTKYKVTEVSVRHICISPRSSFVGPPLKVLAAFGNCQRLVFSLGVFPNICIQ